MKKRRNVFAKPIQAKRTKYDGVLYDSQAEAERAAVLDGLKRAGVVHHVFRQVKADVGESGVDKPYRVDFLVLENRPDGRFDVYAEDVKGTSSPTFQRHKRQWAKRGGVPLRVVERGKVVDVIHGGRQHPEYTWDSGTKVAGIKRRNRAVAAHAAFLASDLADGCQHAVFRDVDVGGTLPKVDFLVVSEEAQGGYLVRADVVRYDDVNDWTPLVESWKQSGPVILQILKWNPDKEWSRPSCFVKPTKSKG